MLPSTSFSQAVLVQEQQWQAGAPAVVADASALVAKQAYLAVQAAVAVLQLVAVLREGEVAAAPPCPAIGEPELKAAAGEVREAAQIGLSQRMHCSVCFTRGQERQVYFAVEGLPAAVQAGAPGAPMCA